MADKKAGEQFYSPPPKLGNWEGFKIFLWNGETSQFLGRTGSSWAKILFFYVVFYAALVGFFAAMLAVFYQTLDNNRPKWRMEEGLIGGNPGLGFRPMPPESNVESTLIWYKHTDKSNWEHWTTEIDKFLESYKPENIFVNNSDACLKGAKAADGKFCNVSMESFHECVGTKDYRYPDGMPCIFLKLNKIFSWKPKIYETYDSLPPNFPKDLKDHFKIAEKTKDIELIWVSCEGENPGDRENIHNTSYYPRKGFPTNYFPFVNVKGYLPPLVAVQFNVTKSVLINIECKAWAHNIQHDRADRRGSVHFELMID